MKIPKIKWQLTRIVRIRDRYVVQKWFFLWQGLDKNDPKQRWADECYQYKYCGHSNLDDARRFRDATPARKQKEFEVIE